MKDKHLQAFMKTAKVFSECSTAKRLKVGCIAVKDNKIISIGYNGTPNNWDNRCESDENQTLPEVLHAETNMIAKLARTGGGSEGCSVFITHSPCMECSKLLYQSGVQHVYYEMEYRSREGIDFLKKVGIHIEQYKMMEMEMED
jgi:dCMP deaminase